MRLPEGWEYLSGIRECLNRSLYGLKLASCSWHSHLICHMERLGFEKWSADAFIFFLVEGGNIAIAAIVDVDENFVVRRKERFDRFYEDINRLVPIND